MRHLLLVLIIASCGRDAKKSDQASTDKVLPVINTATEYFCKDEPACVSACDSDKNICYGSCIGTSLEIRSCKVFKCDGNYNTCMTEVYSK